MSVSGTTGEHKARLLTTDALLGALKSANGTLQRAAHAEAGWEGMRDEDHAGCAGLVEELVRVTRAIRRRHRKAGNGTT